MALDDSTCQRIGRRVFLQQGTLCIAATSMLSHAVASEPEFCLSNDDERIRIGVVTDLHFADKPAAGSRYYRETPQKLAEAIEEFGKRSLDLVVELGDLIDAADDVKTELGYLTRINRDFSTIAEERHYVLGNHCVFTLTKDEFLSEVEQRSSYYSFDQSDVHFIVLDSCFRSDGVPYQRGNFKWTDPNIPEEELEWLKADLKEHQKPTIVFAHQRLDVSNNHGVKNAEQVRQALEASGNVLAVFQGHSHQNDLKEIAGIPYCTMVAMVEGSGLENSGFGVIEIDEKGNIQIDGFRKQQGYEWKGSRGRK